MSKERFEALQREITRLQEIDNKTTERVSRELEDDCQRPNEDCEHESLMDCDCDTDDGGMPFEKAHTNHDIVVPCSKDLDMEWANESDNIQ